MRLLWITEHYPPAAGGMSNSCDRIVYGLRNAPESEIEIEIDLVHLVPATAGNPRPESWRSVQGGRERRWPIGDDRDHDLRVLSGCLQREGEIDPRPWQAVVAFGGTLSLLLGPVIACWLSIPSLTLLRGNDFDTGIFSIRRRTALLQALSISTAVCPVTEAMAHRVRTLLPYSRVEAIANGIDANLWPTLASLQRNAEQWRENLQLDSDTIVIGLIGQLKRKKGADVFINCVAESGVADKVHLVLVGSLDAAVNGVLARHHNAISYSRHEAVLQGALPPYYARCDFVALPSFYDGMPNVLLEAGSLGIPVIASDSGGMPEVIRHDENGLLCNPFDTDDIIAAIRHAAGLSASQRREMGAQLRQNIQQNFSTMIETGRYQKLLAELIEESPETTSTATS
jgi:glycosyltransferase involved in cell wall biosynthesis